MAVMINAGGGGGLDPDELTAEAGDIVKGKIGGVKGNDEPVAGTLELTGDAADSHVMAGKTYYNTDAKQRRVGAMANNGEQSASLNCGQSKTIPAGYTTGGVVAANSLASQTGGTAVAAHIIGGQTVWVNGNKVTGTKPDHGAWSANVGMNGSVAVPEGSHNGGGRVNGPSVADRGAWGTNIGVNGRVAIPEGYHNGGGSVGQSIAVQGADVPGADRAYATGVSCWAGTVNLGVRNGHYLNGVNWIQGNIPTLQPHNIMRGVNIAGIVGTGEGWVASIDDLYNRGAWGIINHVSWVWYTNSNTSHGTIRYDPSQIAIRSGQYSGYVDMLIQSIDVSRYSRLNIICSIPAGSAYMRSGITKIEIGTDYTILDSGSYDIINCLARKTFNPISGAVGEYTYSIDISSIHTSVYTVAAYTLDMATHSDNVYIHKMWFE